MSHAHSRSKPAFLVNHGLNTSCVGSVRFWSFSTCWNQKLYTRFGTEGLRNFARSTFGSLDILGSRFLGPVCTALVSEIEQETGLPMDNEADDNFVLNVTGGRRVSSRL